MSRPTVRLVEKTAPPPETAPAPRPPARPPALSEFQSAAIALEERPIPRLAQSIMLFIVLLVAALVAWASFAQIDRIVTAPGRLLTSEPVIVVQPLETGVIRSLEVTVGAVVRAGDMLVTLDPTFAEADVEGAEERMGSLSAEADRLRSEIAGKPYASRPDDRFATIQRQLFDQRAAERRARLSNLESTEARLEANLTAARAAQDSLRERLRVLGQIVAMREELVRRNVGSQLQLMEAQLNHLSLKEQLATKQADEKEIVHRLEGARQERASFEQEWTRMAMERLLTVSRDMDALNQDLAKAQRRSALVRLRAPADGVVQEIAQRSVGSVARQADPLITIVPLNVPLEVEAEIKAGDISRVRPGDQVRHKLEALPFLRHGHLEGTVRVISEDSFRADDERRPPVYRARITIDRRELRDVPEDFRLIPGMTVTSDIVVGRHSVISYLLYPVLKVFNEGLREP